MDLTREPVEVEQLLIVQAPDLVGQQHHPVLNRLAGGDSVDRVPERIGVHPRMFPPQMKVMQMRRRSETQLWAAWARKHHLKSVHALVWMGPGS